MPFNIIIGISSFISLVLSVIFINLYGYIPGEDLVQPAGLVAVNVIIIIFANILFAAGWIIELVLKAVGKWRRRTGLVMLYVVILSTLLLIGHVPSFWGIKCLADGPARFDISHSDLIGTYETIHRHVDIAYYPYLAKETLVLNADGTFDQVIKTVEGKEWKSNGRWKMGMGEYPVVIFNGRIEAIDTNKEYRLRPRPASNVKSFSLLRHRSEVRIHVQIPSGRYYYYKVK